MMRARPLATAVLAAAFTGLVVAPASADAGVSITSDLGSAVVSLDGPTTISVSGTGFQSIQGGFGGIYVFFGWVDDPDGGSWRPSHGGQTGVDYLYVPDSEAKDNAGYQRFVTFPGSGTASAANGGEVAADGSWELTMVVPGPMFQAVDRDGAARGVDCREVTCGVITIGAHGVANANNETFTPVDFVSSASGGPAGGDTGSSGDPGAAPGVSAEQGGSGEPDGGDDAAQATAPSSGPATIGLEQSTIIAGRVLAFTGIGFQPGEQVVAVLGAGETGAGPLIAGQLGEVAGAVTLPPDLRPGTHVLTLAGAGSGQVAEATISVMADPAALSAAEDAAAGGDLTWPVIAVLVTAAVLALLILSSLVTAVTRRRRHRRAAAAPAAQPGAGQTSSPESGAGSAGAAGAAGTAGSTVDAADTAVLPAVPERRSARERVDA